MRTTYLVSFAVLALFAGMAYFAPHALTEFLPGDTDMVVIAAVCFLGAVMVLSHINRPRSYFGFWVIVGLTALFVAGTWVNIVSGWDIHAGLAENTNARFAAVTVCTVGALAALGQALRRKA